MVFTKLIKDYDHSLSYSGIQGERIARRLDALSQIGLTEEGGSNRISYTKEEREAKELVEEWMKEAGLQVTKDGIGNVIGRLEGTATSATVMSGSHVDSVPNGGHFDGPLGVLAALEVVEAWKEDGFKPEKSLEVVIFTDEEGARFHSGLTGSQVMTGKFNLSKHLELSDEEGKRFEEVLHENGWDVDGVASSKRDFSKIEAFVEVHIEQGKRLEKQHLSVGVVEGIAGPSWLDVTFKGEAAHAGNTPMNDRSDALVAAGRFVAEVEALPSKFSSTAVATVGKLNVRPNGINVVPGEVQMTVDVRDIYEEKRDALKEAVFNKAQSIALERKVDVETTEIMAVAPVIVSDEMQQKAGEAVREVTGQEPYFLPSGAGHDAMIIGREIPMAMLFTRSENGISHNPAEWSSLNDCVQTVHVLKCLLERLCLIKNERKQ